MSEDILKNQYLKNYRTDKTYVGPVFNFTDRLAGTKKEKRYVTKVFDIDKFTEFYKNLKNNQVCKILREGQRQEVLAIVDKDTRDFSLSIQRFTKDTGMPHGQSFNFHSGALIKLIEFIDSLGFIDFSKKTYFKIHDSDIKIQKQFWLDNIDLVQHIKRFDSNLLRDILSKIPNQDKLVTIVNALSKVDSDYLDAAIRQSNYTKSLNSFKEMVEIDSNKDKNLVNEVLVSDDLVEYKAGQPEKIFQNWIEKNLWVFGVDYYQKHNWRIIDDTPNLGSEADLVMETIDGFIDLVELKRPSISSKDLFLFDDSHKSYFPCRDLSLAIGQCLHYLKKLDEKKRDLEKDRGVKVLRPRIKLIIGRSNNFINNQYDALRMINSNLSHIQILTFDDIIKNGDTIISFYKK